MKGLLTRFLRREAHPAIQFVKYAIGGVLATAVDVLVFYIVAIWLLPALGPGDPAARLLGLRLAPGARLPRQSHRDPRAVRGPRFWRGARAGLRHGRVVPERVLPPGVLQRGV